MSALHEAVRRHADAHAGANGVAPSPIAGLLAVRALAPSELMHDVQRPLACLVLEGAKRVTFGTGAFDFSAGHSLLVTADVPTVSQITRASAAAPYCSLVLELDPAVIADLVAQMDPPPDEDTAPVRVLPTEPEVADAALRLVQLLEQPQARPVLQAQRIRELHYWLLAGRHGHAIRRLGRPDGHVHRIARAVKRLRRDFARTLPVDALALEAGMSASAFHRHFKAVTSLSPRQFQKHLRLIEARRLMQSQGLPAGSAAYAVGYESVPQFTREYGRMFGRTPAADARATAPQRTARA
ncbi:AraC family transcriptional regulator [Luteimonas chenhongjianii]|uniref:AraC family transcriptional regulator n=1 Tax=Luteimonas chenhongjianii TaxID=2006110 RepID=A0A290XIG9_9GAMM|nr:AraC family transcriptional regulator [Luteimonas chenhongjianii]ATD68849.1 AraC family transcriptional regulator [Luteimonas chenhongjianii]